MSDSKVDDTFNQYIILFSSSEKIRMLNKLLDAEWRVRVEASSTYSNLFRGLSDGEKEEFFSRIGQWARQWADSIEAI
jgi:hypothetical protein